MVEIEKTVETGTTVFHAEYGTGTVAGYSAARRKIHIRFESGQSVSFPHPDAFEREILRVR